MQLMAAMAHKVRAEIGLVVLVVIMVVTVVPVVPAAVVPVQASAHVALMAVTVARADEHLFIVVKQERAFLVNLVQVVVPLFRWVPLS